MYTHAAFMLLAHTLIRTVGKAMQTVRINANGDRAGSCDESYMWPLVMAALPLSKSAKTLDRLTLTRDPEIEYVGCSLP